MAGRRPTEERIKMVLLYAKFGNYEEVRRQWSSFIKTDPPKPETIKGVYDRFCETGSVSDFARSGRPLVATTEEKMEEAKAVVHADPQTSVSKGAQALDISRSSYHRIMQKLDLKPYRATYVPELSDDDVDRRAEFCEKMLKKLDREPDLINHILWSDESLFELSGAVNRHNNVRWSVANPHAQVDVSHSHQSIMVWCGISSSGLVGPYFFDSPVNAQAYLRVLEEIVWPYARHRRLTFQQDGAAAHYSLVVRNWLDQNFHNKWIGRRGPLEWPARSPDLAPNDFFLWGYLKEHVYASHPATIPQLRNKIKQCCAELPIDLCAKVCQSVTQRFQTCLELGGQQIHD